MNAHNSAMAEKNMLALSQNSYPGRGIVMGMNETGGYVIQVYWIRGRSENSRNRIFGIEGGRLFTEAADPVKVKDSSLIIYNAMLESHRHFVVSNGVQTDKVIDGILAAYTFQGSLRGLEYEPDAPNFTPRITGICSLDLVGREDPFFGLDIIRKSPWDNSCDRFFYRYDKIESGFGYCLTTYTGDGNPLPPFAGEPLLMPLLGDIDAVLDTYWKALNEENRVALAVKFIALQGTSWIKVTNKFTKV